MYKWSVRLVKHYDIPSAFSDDIDILSYSIVL